RSRPPWSTSQRAQSTDSRRQSFGRTRSCPPRLRRGVMERERSGNLVRGSMLNVSSLLRDRFLGATLALLACTGASAAELNTLKALTVKPTKVGTEVVVSGERSPAFTAFRSEERRVGKDGGCWWQWRPR